MKNINKIAHQINEGKGWEGRMQSQCKQSFINSLLYYIQAIHVLTANELLLQKKNFINTRIEKLDKNEINLISFLISFLLFT